MALGGRYELQMELSVMSMLNHLRRSRGFAATAPFPPPVDAWRVARSLGLEVYEVQSDSFNNPGFGLLMKIEGTWSILVNARQRRPFKNIAIAHEIAHYLFDGEICTVVNARDDSAYFQRETRADLFARHLLMPASTVLEFWVDGWDPREMAAFFVVPKSDMLEHIGHLTHMWENHREVRRFYGEISA